MSVSLNGYPAVQVPATVGTQASQQNNSSDLSQVLGHNSGSTNATSSLTDSTIITNSQEGPTNSFQAAVVSAGKPLDTNTVRRVFVEMFAGIAQALANQQNRQNQ